MQSLFRKTSRLTNRTFLSKFNFCCPTQTAIIRKQAPNFKGTAFWNGEFKQISLQDFKGQWVVLFFYPLDFTFVCPTEIVAFSDMAAQFKQENCQVIACSVDSHFTHREWALKSRSEGGLNPMNIPMLADIGQRIASDYNVKIADHHDPNHGVALRGTFIIDDKGVLRHYSVNDLPVGRNPEEVLRTLKAFQHTDKHGEVCPANWEKGKKTMKPSDPNQLKEFWKTEHAKPKH